MSEVPGKGEGGRAEARGVSERSVLGLLGIAARAGAIVRGTQPVRAAAREGGVHQVILAVDSAPGQRAKLIPLLKARRIPYHIVFSRVELGTAVGRSPVSALGISDPGLAKRAGELLVALPRLREQQGGSETDASV